MSERVKTYWSAFIKNSNPTEIEALILSLEPEAQLALAYLFEIWALPHQLPPSEDFSTWIILGGRGAGKTRAGAEWVRTRVEGTTPLAAGRNKEVAFIGASYHDVVEVMIFGPSGIMSVTPPDRKPHWNSTRKLLRWPNGARAHIFSAHTPEGLRGPQFDTAWCDEFSKWPDARLNWDMLQFALRLGDNPQALVTTTPKPSAILREILKQEKTAVTHASTYDNQQHLSARFLENIKLQYENTWLGQQEIYGKIVTENVHGLWRPCDITIENHQSADNFDRIVVAIDPAVTKKARSDSCGIIVAGARYPNRDPRSWHAKVLADETLTSADPEDWVKRGIELYHQWNASAILAETNQGGDLIETLIRVHDPYVQYRGLFAHKDKVRRAEPVSALYRQGRVTHAKHFGELEQQLLNMTTKGFEGKGSPDRVDALVWALDELLLVALQKQRTPHLRSL